jgi:Fic family protein
MARNPSYNIDQILQFIKDNPKSSSQDILSGLSLTISISTLKRGLQELIANGLVKPTGELKSRRYSVSDAYHIIRPVDIEEYYKKEIDERIIQTGFNQKLIGETLHAISFFTSNELAFLNTLQEKFKSNSSKLSKNEYKIEGNTYSLLETEQLLKDKQTASGKTKDEAVMLLNHKDALDFIIEHPDFVSPLSVSIIEDIHSILIKDLDIARNIRSRRVGISGTNYRPLENEFQIKGALTDMCKLVNAKENIFDKALLALTLISYIQPFYDGNKRTARIICNAILINNNYCPISFRTIDSIEYKKAMLIFYEQTNINPFKKVFIDQFEFAVNTYF